MAWLQLTAEKHYPILLDSEKILMIRPHARGAHITFTTSALDKDGRPALKAATVCEDVSYIGKLMKATKSRW